MASLHFLRLTNQSRLFSQSSQSEEDWFSLHCLCFSLLLFLLPPLLPCSLYFPFSFLLLNFISNHLIHLLFCLNNLQRYLILQAFNQICSYFLTNLLLFPIVNDF